MSEEFDPASQKGTLGSAKSKKLEVFRLSQYTLTVKNISQGETPENVPFMTELENQPMEQHQVNIKEPYHNILRTEEAETLTIMNNSSQSNAKIEYLLEYNPTM